MGLPELALYVNQTPAQITAGGAAVRAELEQYERLQAFLRENFYREEPDGTLVNERGFNGYETLDRFEQLLRKSLNGIIKARVGGETASSTVKAAPSWQGNPYRGLEVFDFRHAPIFFGRTRAVDDALRALRSAIQKGSAPGTHFACSVQ